MRSMYTEPLRDNEIRIARLEPGKVDDPMQCHLVKAKLDDSVEYDALSYEWNGVPGHAYISCANVEFQVTRNMAEAMRALRLKESHKDLWIDAICINQSDNEERSSQVPKMTDIYAAAKSVIVWLGPGIPGVRKAIQMFPFLARLLVERDLESGNRSASIPYIDDRPQEGSILKSGSTPFMKIDRPQDLFDSFMSIIPQCGHLSDDEMFHFDDNEVWKAMDHLFCNSYFFRSWIVQEVSVAKDIVLWCGHDHIDWPTFQIAALGRQLLVFKDKIGPYNMRMIQDIRQRHQKSLRSGINVHLDSVLTGFVNSTQTDPRDRIYAARGLVLPRAAMDALEPNYDESVSKVFTNTMRVIMDSSDSLWVWSLGTQRSRRSLLDLPTWIPEFTMQHLYHYREGPESFFSWSFPRERRVDGRSLYLKGFLMDEVSDIFHIGRGRDITSTLKLFNDVKKWLRLRDSSLFAAYPSLNSAPNADEMRLIKSNDEAKLLLAAYKNLPRPDLDALHCLIESASKEDPTGDGITNLESLGLLLLSTSLNQKKNDQTCGSHLLLCLLEIMAWYDRDIVIPETANMDSAKSEANDDFYRIQEQVPQHWREWLKIANHLMDPEDASSSQMETLDELYHATIKQQVELSNTTGITNNIFFVTKKGHFGHAPASDAKIGQVVAMLRGAACPYLLERKANYFELVSCAYLQGFMTRHATGGNFSYTDDVETIELR